MKSIPWNLENPGANEVSPHVTLKLTFCFESMSVQVATRLWSTASRAVVIVSFTSKNEIYLQGHVVTVAPHTTPVEVN